LSDIQLPFLYIQPKQKRVFIISFQRKEDLMKMKRWFALVVVLIIGFASGAFAQPYGEPISLDMAKKAAAAAFAEAKKNNWVPVVVLVTDGSGSLLYLEKMDGTLGAGMDVAIAKPRSAAAFRRSTKDFADLLAQGGLGNRFLVLPHAIPVEGGLPIIINGKVVGAIGASGVTAAQEGLICAAGVNAIK
jgi:glc operon protein GlcG